MLCHPKPLNINKQYIQTVLTSVVRKTILQKKKHNQEYEKSEGKGE